MQIDIAVGLPSTLLATTDQYFIVVVETVAAEGFRAHSATQASNLDNDCQLAIEPNLNIT